MNIFYLDKDPETCAQMHCDQHVVKMIVEYGQMLSTAHRVCGKQDDVFYKVAHLNHPSCKWVRAHLNNYLYTRNLFMFLCIEYTMRYDKIHKTQQRLLDALYDPPSSIPAGESVIPQCMPDAFKDADPIKAYRNFYRLDKSRFATWNNVQTPTFMQEQV